MVRGSWALVGASAHVPDAGNPKTVDTEIRLASSPVSVRLDGGSRWELPSECFLDTQVVGFRSERSGGGGSVPLGCDALEEREGGKGETGEALKVPVVRGSRWFGPGVGPDRCGHSVHFRHCF